MLPVSRIGRFVRISRVNEICYKFLRRTRRTQRRIANQSNCVTEIPHADLLVRQIVTKSNLVPGIFLLISSPIFRADDSKVEDLWWAPYVQDFRNLDERALPPRAHTGIAFTTISLDVPRYLANLQTRVRRLGGRVIRFRVPTRGGINVALDRIDAVLQPGDLDGLSRSGGKPKDAVKPTAYVNCTGMGALHLVPDLGVYPIRGQTVLVKGEATAARVLTSFDEKTQKWYTAYVIPRKGSGGTILGGTKEAGRWQAEAEEQTTKDILERCRELAPELLTGRKGRGNGGEGEDEEEVEGEFEVIRVNVGRRPGREGGARVELDEALGKNRILVHCYGHAGSG